MIESMHTLEIVYGPLAAKRIHDLQIENARLVDLDDILRLIRSYPDGYNWTEWLADKLEAEFRPAAALDDEPVPVEGQEHPST